MKIFAKTINKSIVAVLAIALVAVLAIGLSACDSKSDSNSNKLTVIESQITEEGKVVYARIDGLDAEWILIDSYTIYNNGVVVIYAQMERQQDYRHYLANQAKIVTTIDKVTFQVAASDFNGNRFE